MGGIVLVDGYLYGSADRFRPGRWICLELRTGRRMYAERGVGKGSVTYADGMLYNLSEKGMVGPVPAARRSHKLAGRFQIPKGARGPTWAHPVVCGGRLYIRHGDFLYAYHIKAR